MLALYMQCAHNMTSSRVPVTTSAHSTRSNVTDIGKDTTAVLKNDLLQVTPGRSHRTFQRMKLNPLWNWDKEKTKEWIEKKKKDFVKFRGTIGEDEPEECDDEDENT